MQDSLFWGKAPLWMVGRGMKLLALCLCARALAEMGSSSVYGI